MSSAPLLQSKYAVTKVPVSANHQEFAKLIDYNFLWQAGLKPLDEIDYLESMRSSDVPFLKESMYRRDNTIMALFEKNKNMVEKPGAHRLRWDMELPNTDLRATFIKSEEGPSVTESGLRGTEFDFTIDSSNYGINDVIVFDDFRDQPVLLRSEPRPSGQGYTYTAVLLTDDDTESINLTAIPQGTRITQIGSLIGEATTHRGNVALPKGAAFIEFETNFTRMGWRMKITDQAQMAMETYAFAERTKLKRDPSGRVLGEPVMLTNRAEAEFRAVIAEQVDYYLTYGRQTNRVSQITDQITGNVLETGSGFFEFANTSYVHEYMPETDGIEVIEDQVVPLWNNKIPIEQRKVVVMGGTGAWKVWSRWMKENNARPYLEDDSYAIDVTNGMTPDRVGIAINKNQITKMFLEPFGSIEFVYAAWMDNDKNSSKRYKGLPAQSYEMLVIDYGYGSGIESNIYIATDPLAEQFGYSIGTWSPYGKTLGNAQVNTMHRGLGNENAYELICEKKFGFVMKNPSKMMRFLPSIK